MSGQLLVGQPSASSSRQNFREAPSVPTAVLALVIAERLFVQIAKEMERLDTDIGPFQAALKQTPEVLKSVGMHAAIDVLLGVVYELMDVFPVQSGIGRQFISEQFSPGYDVFLDVILQSLLLAVGDMLDANLPGFAVQQANYQLLARAAGSDDLLGFLVRMHITGESTDHAFVGFDRAATTHLLEATTLHREPDAVEHKPCGFLTDVQISSYFARTNPVLAIADQPDGGQPLGQRQGGILENSSDLDGELAALVLTTAFPAALIGEEVNLFASAGWTFHDAIRPATRDHVRDTAVFVGEIPDRISQTFGYVTIRFHALNLAQGARLVKSIFTLNRACHSGGTR
jgi:hypothetical protein